MTNITDITRRIEAEGAAKHIEALFQSIYANILTAHGGEEKLEPFHLANIRGSLTRAKHHALIPLQEIINGKETAAGPVAEPVRASFRV